MKKSISLLLILVLLLPIIPYSTGQDPPFLLENLKLSTDEDYYLKGDTMTVTVSGLKNQLYTLNIRDPYNQTVYSKQHKTNTQKISNVEIPIGLTVSHGTYVLNIEYLYDGKTHRAWRMVSVLNTDGFTPASFPFTRTHKNLEIKVDSDWVLTAQAGEDIIQIEFPDFLKDVFTVNCYVNDMMFVARLRNAFMELSIDLSLAFIHSGVKMIVNGSIDQPSTFTFKFNSPKRIIHKIENIRSGNLVFDWYDLKKARKAFTYNDETKELTVNIPRNFDLDPMIFTDGFESGDYSNWNAEYESNGTVDITSTTVYDGSYASNSSVTAANSNNYGYVNKTLVSSYATLYLQAQVRIDDYPSFGGNDFWFMSIGNETSTQAGWGGTAIMGIVKNATDNNYYFKFWYGRNFVGGYTEVENTTTQWQTGDWHLVEVKATISGVSSSNYQVWVNETKIFDIDQDNDAWGDSNYVWVGCVEQGFVSDGVMNIFIDDVKVNDSYIGGNADPTITSATITDMLDTDNIYSQKGDFTFRVIVADTDGATDVDSAFLRIKQSGTTRYEVKYDDDDTPNWSEVTGGTLVELDTSGSTRTNDSPGANSVTFDFEVNFNWGATEESDLDIDVKVCDQSAACAGYTSQQTDYFDVITTLMTSSIECTDPDDPDQVFQWDEITLDASIRYTNDPSSSTASSYYPPDAEFTAIHIYDQGNNDMGSDTSVVNGDGQVTFNVGSVGEYRYNVYLDMVDSDYTDGELTTTETVTAVYEEKGGMFVPGAGVKPTPIVDVVEVYEDYGVLPFAFLGIIVALGVIYTQNRFNVKHRLKREAIKNRNKLTEKINSKREKAVKKKNKSSRFQFGKRKGWSEKDREKKLKDINKKRENREKGIKNKKKSLFGR